jgi:hypothetical protein
MDSTSSTGMTNWAYRQKMIRHGQPIIANNFNHAQNQFAYRPIYSSSSPNGFGGGIVAPGGVQLIESVGSAAFQSYPTPFLYKSSFDLHRPPMIAAEETDLQRSYLWEMNYQQRLVAPLFQGRIPGTAGTVTKDILPDFSTDPVAAPKK